MARMAGYDRTCPNEVRPHVSVFGGADQDMGGPGTGSDRLAPSFLTEHPSGPSQALPGSEADGDPSCVQHGHSSRWWRTLLIMTLRALR